MESLLIVSGVYDSRVVRCCAAFDWSRWISPLRFPVAKNSARKNTPDMSQGLIQTDIAIAPATALMTKLTAIVRISANGSCLSQIV